MELEYMLKKYKEIEKQDLQQVTKAKGKRATIIPSFSEIKSIETMVLSLKKQNS